MTCLLSWVATGIPSSRHPIWIPWQHREWYLTALIAKHRNACLPKSSYAYPIYGKPESLALQRSLPELDKGEDWWDYQEGRVTQRKQEEFMRGYSASVTYLDAQIGKVHQWIGIEFSELSRKLKAQSDGGECL